MTADTKAEGPVNIGAGIAAFGKVENEADKTTLTVGGTTGTKVELVIVPEINIELGYRITFD
ncbi:hypothetical protein [Flammeovirga agarivorans]|uniref:Uncharacterized protein n=1 Tax=Flammeovirga agarivorans TaxID=2726742 RepID=A0A7X8SKQ6_9BACT|nr:hypothetical protein [Flammeovirga agarivorans]NLR92009.1 hypothetical protein [Flammeovirga agarivorans]